MKLSLSEEKNPNQVTESQVNFKVVKESEILKELKNLKRLDDPPGIA